jgi:hypothetical protein
MRRLLPLTSLLLVFALVSALRAADEPKNDPSKSLRSAGEITGKLTQIDSTGKGLRVQIQVQVPNPQAAYNLQQAQIRLARARNPQERFNAQRDIQQQQANLYRTQNKDLDFQMADDVKVRMKNPPVAFDEKGNPKKYTAKELKELKGDDKGPGYPAEIDALKPGQFVTVTVKVKKDAGRPKPMKDDDFGAADNRPIATQVMIVAEAPAQ